jgi:hypothetical protein
MTTACGTPVLPVVGCVLPGASATPAPPPPQPTQAPTPTVTMAPHPVATTVVVPDPVSTQAPVAVMPVVPVVVAPQPTLVALPPAPAVQAVVQQSAAPAASDVAPLSGIVASSFALVVFGLIGVALLASFLSGLRPSPTRSPSYGGTVKPHRTRLWTGLGVLGLAAVVGGVGWYRISGEPLLNRQIPFLASAGIAVVVLAVLGAALIVAEQLRTDQNRIGDLEEAVRSLTEALSPLVEAPARGRESGALLK